MKKNTFIIAAAGGNATAIEILKHGLSRQEYVVRGNELLAENQDHNVEQAGFLIPEDQHFEMSGGEFCGNAARSAAILFFQISNEPQFEFTMSGFKGQVKAKVKQLLNNRYDVTCTFPELKTQVTPVRALGQDAALVDLGGIVHVVVEGNFPADNYETQHRQITDDLKLTERDAVGVCWISRIGNIITMHPVVWVRSINSFFYESSCGSGTIAVGRVTGLNSVIQPTGQNIDVEFSPNAVHLHSTMEVTHEYARH